jgi:hypothetical protein
MSFFFAKKITFTSLNFKFEKILDHFNCCVCLCELETTYITRRCAHRFCEKCIRKSIEQFHKCPLCNCYLESTDLIKDTNFDSLKGDSI